MDWPLLHPSSISHHREVTCDLTAQGAGHFEVDAAVSWEIKVLKHTNVSLVDLGSTE